MVIVYRCCRLLLTSVVTLVFWPGPVPLAPAWAVAQEAAPAPKPAPQPAPAAKDTVKKALPTVRTERAQGRDLTRTLELNGSVTASRLARMASPGEGPVLDCRVREGDLVRSGERVLRIGRNTAAQALVTASQAALKEQEQELKRVRQLVESGAIPGAQLDTALSKFESAKAQFAKAKESAEDYSVTAPWDGIVSKVLVRDGDYVAPRTPLVELFDPGSLVLRFFVPEAEAVAVRRDMAVTVQLDAYPGKTLQGRVQRIYPELDTRMRTRAVEAVVIDQVALLPGMFARIAVHLQAIAGAVTVPAEAVTVAPNGERVAFVVEGGKALRRKVATGLEQEGRIQVLEGIQVGDQVIVAGHEKLKDGMAVQVSGEIGR